jgi:hypothetical protein
MYGILMEGDVERSIPRCVDKEGGMMCGLLDGCTYCGNVSHIVVVFWWCFYRCLLQAMWQMYQMLLYGLIFRLRLGVFLVI